MGKKVFAFTERRAFFRLPAPGAGEATWGAPLFGHFVTRQIGQNGDAANV